jgi:glycosyltransferase involved in cell wall biosynthesis
VKILVVHNFYQQPGGEDQVFQSEARMLEKRGHEVLRFTEDNARVDGMGKVQLAIATLWNRDAYKRLHALVSEERPEIVHFHNTFPLLSPSCYHAARHAGAAVVQTLHNYRLLCPSATLLRDGAPCEDCVGLVVPWHGVQHACYRGSRTASAGVTAMLAMHNTIGTWDKAVDAYIALTDFSRSLFITGGLPSERIYVKPNFTEPDPGMGPGGDYYLYAGRISPEKGLDVMIEAWRSNPSFPPLKIIGDGPQASRLQTESASLGNIEWLGRVPRQQVLSMMKQAKALVLPSIWYENFPVTIVEAYATGLPVIVSDAGTLPELVLDGTTGYVFQSRNSEDLARKIVTFETRCGASFESLHSMREAARRQFENSYREDQNYLLLLAIYRNALKHLRAIA